MRSALTILLAVAFQLVGSAASYSGGGYFVGAGESVSAGAYSGHGVIEGDGLSGDHASVRYASSLGTLRVLQSQSSYDFGDAPDTGTGTGVGDYQTTFADGGAWHVAQGPLLGASRDIEFDGQPSSAADGDGADEDGVVLSALAVGSEASVSVSASGPGKVSGWIDFNQDGDWTDPGEQVVFDLSVVAGGNSIAFLVPASAVTGNTYARFRISSAGGLGSTGGAPDGEVEDYMVNVGTPITAEGLGDGVNTGNGDIDQFIIVQDGSNNSSVSVDGHSAHSFASGSNDGFVLNGSRDDDVLTIDFSNGNPLPAGGVTFNGGGGNDTIIITGGSLTLATYTFDNASDGSIVLDGFLLAYTGLEPIIDNSAVVQRVLEFTGGTETITVSSAGNETTIDSTLGESLTITQPTGSLTINAGNGDDTVQISEFGSAWSNATVNVNGGSGDDTITVSRSSALVAAIDADGDAGTDTFRYVDEGVAATDSGSQITSAGIFAVDHFNFESTSIELPPDITVLQGGVAIADGDDSPTTVDGTDFGFSKAYPFEVLRTFTIRNDGAGDLNLSLPITLGGPGAAAYQITSQPTASVLAPGASTSFEIRFAPETSGNRPAVVTIQNDTLGESTFDFAITGRIVPGAIDDTYNAGVGPNQMILDAAVQPDGRLIVGGAFTFFNGISRRYIARLTVDGALDSTFDPGTGAAALVNDVEIQADGKIVVGGRFTSFNGGAAGRVVRLNPNGSVDTSFLASPGANNEVIAVAIQPDQKVLIGGTFTSVNGVSRTRIARLNSDGTVDTGFNPGVGPDNTVRAIQLQADGKILVGGNFRKWNGTTTTRLLRLNSDGSVDSTFTSPFPDNGYVSQIIRSEEEGAIFAAGGTRRLAKMANDGSVIWDVGIKFNSDPSTMMLTSEGKLLVGGLFTTFNNITRTRFLRLNADGTVDDEFDPEPGPDKRFRRLVVQPDGRILAVGEFRNYQGQTRNFVTRIINDLAAAAFFTQQPVGGEMYSGVPFSLSATIRGAEPIEYRWYRDGIALTDHGQISGTRTPTLSFGAIRVADAGTYQLVASNPNGDAASAEAVVTVLANQQPTMDPLGDLNLLEDAPEQTVSLSGIGPGSLQESNQLVTVTAISSNPELIPHPTVVYVDGDATGTLRFTPMADANGTATITVTAGDNGGAEDGGQPEIVRAFTVAVSAVNDPPTVQFLQPQVHVLEDSGAFSQPGFATIVPGPANESGQVLTRQIGNDNPALFATAPAIDHAGLLTFEPVPDAFGSATVTVQATDDGGGSNDSGPVTFVINVIPVNDQPDFNIAGEFFNFDENSGSGSAAIIAGTTFGPLNESGQQVLRYEIVGNSNPALFSVQPVVSAGGVLGLTTAADVVGLSEIRIRMVDDGGDANGGVDTSPEKSFAIIIGPPNFPPKFDLSATALSVLEDAGPQLVSAFVSNIDPGRADETNQTVTVTVSSDNPSLFRTAPALVDSGNGAYALAYTTADDASGTATITVTATDDGIGNVASSQVVVLTVTDVNDAPTLNVSVPTINVLEDAGAQSIANVITAIDPGAADESDQTVSLTIQSNDNPGLFAAGPVLSDAGLLTFTGAADRFGTAVLTIVAVDDGGTANAGANTSSATTVTITLEPVNDEPSFVQGGNVTVFRGDGVYDAVWATDLNAGAANETQNLSFVITANDNPGLFAAGPSVDPATGNLAFTPAATAGGTANISVELRDDGGVSGGGDDRSIVHHFSISIFGTKVHVAGNPALNGDSILIPVHLNGGGIESSLSFTLNYETNRLSFSQAATGGASGGASLVVNSEVPGKLGVLIGLSAGNALAAGDNHMVDLTFNLAATATAGVSTLTFGSELVRQQVTDADASVIDGVAYLDSSVTLEEGTIEGDVTPRPLGDDATTLADVIQIGRFAAALDVPNEGREFQAADTAPRDSGGDGELTLADWIQTMRYVAGLDVAAALAGPTAPSALAPSALQALNTGGREVTVNCGTLTPGQTTVASVELDALGDEAGLSCSVNFNPALLEFVSGELGTDAGGAMLLVNTRQVGSGAVGVVLALPPGTSLAAGRRQMLELTFQVSGNATGSATVGFGSSPVSLEIADEHARRLAASFVTSSFPIELPAGYSVVGISMVNGLPRLTFGNSDGSAVTAQRISGLVVYAAGDVTATVWERLENALVVVGGRVQILDPDAVDGVRFYRVEVGDGPGTSQ